MLYPQTGCVAGLNSAPDYDKSMKNLTQSPSDAETHQEGKSLDDIFSS